MVTNRLLTGMILQVPVTQPLANLTKLLGTRYLREKMSPVPTKTQLSNFLGTPGEDYFKGNPKSLNFYFLVIWWGKSRLNFYIHGPSVECSVA